MFISMGTAKRDVLMHIVCTAYARHTLCVRDVLLDTVHEKVRGPASKPEGGRAIFLDGDSLSLSLPLELRKGVLGLE